MVPTCAKHLDSTRPNDENGRSETAPTEGTLKVFPDVLLSNAYIILRPFFTPIVPSDSNDIFKPEGWKFGVWTLMLMRLL